MSRKRQKDDKDRYRSRSRSSSSNVSGHSRSIEDEEEDGVRIHVAGIGLAVSKKDLQHVFEKYGGLKEVWVAKSPPCFAFVVFRDKEDAEDAVKATDGITLCGSRIRVTFARPRTRGRGRRGFDPNMRCYQCGDKGHFSRDCPDTKYGYKRPPSRSVYSNQQSSNRDKPGPRGRSPPSRRRTTNRSNSYRTGSGSRSSSRRTRRY
ncbi:serine/arginine-rich splicing factor 7 [Anabrus simplex]|uniref:serine/arginine-rich splicing factor 7 n=1 Tax=Anabrus simplex TaxID=316456 RepID=UPI0034DD6680